MHLNTQAILQCSIELFFYPIPVYPIPAKSHRLDAKLLLEALGKIARTAEAHHIADFADAIVFLSQEAERPS